MNKPFNLEAFRNGQKALTRDGRVATFAAICEECEKFSRLLVLLKDEEQVMFFNLDGKFEQPIGTYDESRYDLVSMVSRHQHLIGSYDPEDVWQYCSAYTSWTTLTKPPNWSDEYDYRLHPHNDLIKAHKKGAKIQEVVTKLEDSYSFEGDHTGIKQKTHYVDDTNPTWDEAKIYRIKPEPKTKTVYEWIHEANVGNVNYFVSSWVADEDVEYFFGLDAPKQKYKTGRRWEVEV